MARITKILQTGTNELIPKISFPPIKLHCLQGYSETYMPVRISDFMTSKKFVPGESTLVVKNLRKFTKPQPTNYSFQHQNITTLDEGSNDVEDVPSESPRPMSDRGQSQYYRYINV